MANLSNINGKFVVEQTTGYVGVGTTDPNFLIEAAGANSEIALNSTSASIYRLRSTSSDSFIITKNGVGDRLVIDGPGNATFAGEVNLVRGIKMTAGTSSLYATDGALSYYSASNGVYLNGAGASGWLRLNASGVENNRNSINIYGSAGDFMNFQTANLTRLIIDASGNAIFTGKVGIGTTLPLEKLNIVETTATAGTFFPVAISGARYQADYGVGIAFRPENNSSAYANKTAIVASGGGYGYNQADLHFCLNQSATITDEVNLSDTRMIIKKSGNVGIGTTLPLSLSANTSSLSVNSTRTDLTGGLFLKANDVSKVQLYWGTSGFINEIISGSCLWYTNNALKMELLAGDTSQLTLKAKSGTYSQAAILRLEGTNSSTYGGTVIADSTITSFTDGTAYGAHLAFSLNNTSNVVTERMRITSAGDVLVHGTYNPYSQANRGNITLGGSNSNIIAFTNNSSGKAYIYHNGLDFEINNGVAGKLFFATNSTERMRITGGGNMQMADGSMIFLGSLLNTGNNWNFNSYSNGNLYLQQDGISNLGVFDGTSGTYTAMSDINKKKDFEDSEIGLKEVMGLKPKFYRMKTHSEDSDKLLGFLAQEVKEFIPQAYVESGADDNKFIGLTEMPIIAALTKAIQELKADNDSLKARIETLENK